MPEAPQRSGDTQAMKKWSVSPAAHHVTRRSIVGFAAIGLAVVIALTSSAPFTNRTLAEVTALSFFGIAMAGIAGAR